MILIFLFSYITLGSTTCTTWRNIWEVYRYDTVDEAAIILGLPDYQVIMEMNPGINVQFISPAQQVTVPYVMPISSPASWTTTGCSHILHLREAPTAGFSDLENPKKTSQSTVGSAVNSPLITSSPTSKYTLPLYKPPSIISQSNSASSMHNTHSNGAASTIGSQHSSATTISSMKDFEVQSHPTKTATGIETDAQSNTTTRLQGASTTPTTSILSIPVSTRSCHEPNSTFYTHNETQAAFAKSFCQVAGLHIPTFEIKNFQSDIKTQLYMYSIESLPNCTMQTPNVFWPNFCSEVMIQNYLQCNNGGMGGYTDWDCLRLRYKPLFLYIEKSTNLTISF
ncbi:hypothetical protein V8C42DRAFT_336805 [Trichoderma barbatum]